jgi:hypothetical protein
MKVLAKTRFEEQLEPDLFRVEPLGSFLVGHRDRDDRYVLHGFSYPPMVKTLGDSLRWSVAPPASRVHRRVVLCHDAAACFADETRKTEQKECEEPCRRKRSAYERQKRGSEEQGAHGDDRQQRFHLVPSFGVVEFCWLE